MPPRRVARVQRDGWGGAEPGEGRQRNMETNLAIAHGMHLTKGKPMIFATGLIDVLIPLVAGIGVLVLPIRPKSPNEPEDKVKARRKSVRICGVGALALPSCIFS